LMDILYIDKEIIVIRKPSRVLSTDEPGGVPELVRKELGDGKADVRTVHRLDRVVSGLMVLARNAHAASELSRQIREGELRKEYTAVIHGDPGESGTLRDLLWRDKARKMTFVASAPGKDVQEAVLDFERLWTCGGLSRVHIVLHTGRTHQIRVQFASRGLPLAGERKYAGPDDPCELALFSCALHFRHPSDGRDMNFSLEPDDVRPWNAFEENNDLQIND